MNIFKSAVIALLSLSALQASAGNKIKCYFNHAVDNSVSTGVNAININGSIDDTLISYINRSKYTLDIAVYNFTASTSSLKNVADAINAAYTRGVKIRWIHNGDPSVTANSGLSLINPAIPTLGSPSTSGFTIMHNKFMIVDGKSSNPDDAIVWTGSTNWSTTQFNTDFNNIVIIQDSALAHAYLGQFNMMWGDTGMTPNSSASKFGHLKTDLGRHNFMIDGRQVELYFSPADNTGSRILSTINTAQRDLYFGMYTFTYQSYADAIVAKKNAGVYVAGINDNFSHTYTPYNTFVTNLGSLFKEYTGSGIYHNKYLIVDAADTCSDPIVLTGSHNWSLSANTDNDENTLIIHDPVSANQFYQSFKGDFNALGGSIARVNGCATAVPIVEPSVTGLVISPNPTHVSYAVSCKLNQAQQIIITLTSIDGKSCDTIFNEWQPGGYFKRGFKAPAPGVYLLKIITGTDAYTQRLVSQ